VGSSANDIPERIKRNNRDPDPNFELAERLYRRCKKDQVSDDGKLLPAAIGYKNWSVNREKYSEPEEVLIRDWLSWGIAFFRVEHLPANMKSTEGANVFDFRAIHAPLDDNYAHTEIVTYKNGLLAMNPDPPLEVKKKYRQIISDRSSIIKAPEV
jgi:hypothetical protein